MATNMSTITTNLLTKNNFFSY